MSKKLKKHSKNNPDTEFSFKLKLKDTEVDINRNGNFKISMKSSRGHKNEWFSEDGSSGKVSTKHLSKKSRWKEYTDDLTGIEEEYRYGDELYLGENENDKKVIGAMPSGEGSNLFLFEQKRIRRQNGKTIIKGRLLSDEFVIEHAEKLAGAFGTRVVRNHLLVENALMDGNISSLRTLPIVSMLNVSNNFWENIDTANNEITKILKEGRASEKPKSSQDNLLKSSYFKNPFKKVGNVINNTVLKPIHDKVIEPISENVVKTAAKVINDAVDYIEKAIDDTNELIITPAEDVIDDSIDLIDNAIHVKANFSETINFDLIEQQYSETPFSANLSANSSIKVDIIFNKGYLGAAEDLSTVSLAITPQLEMKANAGIELDPLILGYSKTLDGPYYPILNPAVGEVSVASYIDFNFEATLSPGDGIGGGVDVKFSPKATLIVKDSKASIEDLEENFTFTSDFDRFKNFKPEADFKAVITPRVTFTALPVIPNSVPTVGGMGLGNVEVSYLNPIVFSYDTNDLSTLKGSTSGVIGTDLVFLGNNNLNVASVDVYTQEFALDFG
tara:strand:+ start:283 stop:1956 length:1674 start_codon:yes stop_codon:yes gene_type:complete